METIRILYPAIAEEQNNELNEWNVYRHTPQDDDKNKKEFRL